MGHQNGQVQGCHATATAATITGAGSAGIYRADKTDLLQHTLQHGSAQGTKLTSYTSGQSQQRGQGFYGHRNQNGASAHAEDPCWAEACEQCPL